MSNHIWNFSTVGGVKRVNLESGADLKALEHLDQKLWTALSCPVNGLEIDPKTLSLLDQDNDGQIRVPEIISAVNWITSLIKNPDDLLNQNEVLPLSAINDATEEGKYLLTCAQIILKNLGKENATEITIEDTSDFTKIFASTPFNGDGIITEDSTEQAGLKNIINDIISCLGSLDDRGGKPGVDAAFITQFYEACNLYSTWYAKAEGNSGNILPFGIDTPAAYEAFQKVQNKINDYFLRCKLAAFDPASTQALNLMVARVEAISAQDLFSCMDEISSYPLAKIEAGKTLPLTDGMNPAWESQINSFYENVFLKIFPSLTHLNESDWKTLIGLFEPYQNWLNEKAGMLVEPLGLTRVNEILAANNLPEFISLIEMDMELADEAASIIRVDQLVRFYKDIFTLLKNFVTFYDFYSPGKKAIFQAGTLFIDQRSCDLCIKVNDMGKHSAMVSLSGMYLIYCECRSKTSADKIIIVAALTNGDIDNLIVGRNAVFYDRKGVDWDATIIKIVENPISIRQAFWTPYRKVSRFIETQINKVAAAQENKVESQTTGSIEQTANKVDSSVANSVASSAPASPAAPAAPAPPPQPFDVGKFVGIFAAISLALGALGTALASIIAGFMGLVWWKMPLAIAGIMLLISGPSMIMAYLKLRKRNLAPILDANGWAINARAIVNIKFGNTLTHLATLPKGSIINLNDPFAEKKRPFLKIIIILSFLAGIALYFILKYELM